jgi:hypothetical protein
MAATSPSYNISSAEVLQRANGNKNLATAELVARVRSGEIWFPYQRTFQLPPATLFANLKTMHAQTKISPNYRLYSYNPSFASYLPPKFRGQSLLLVGNPKSYENADVLSDYFIEEVRLQAKRYDQRYSPLECWNQDECLKGIMTEALNASQITPPTLRDALYKTVAETGIFNPSWARSLLEVVMGPDLAGKKWLDISSGWGDRLLAAMSLDMDYVGFDPNVELKPGHDGMIAMFGDPNRHRVIYEPFEKATIPPGPYDVILTSPPYFTIEEYVAGQTGQSIVSYPEKTQWMVWFLFASLNKAWDNLKEGGYLILHLGDSIKKDKNGTIIETIATTEPANIFIENYLPGASWEGVIGLEGKSGYPRPTWVWRKVGRTEPRNVWEPDPNYRGFGHNKQLSYSQRTLLNTYPELQAELINFYAAKYAPNYPIRKTNCKAIRDHVAVQLPQIPREYIDYILGNCLLISALLETLGADSTIQECINIIATVLPSIQTDPNILTQVYDQYGAKFAPNYAVRKANGKAIRDHISQSLPNIPREWIDNLLADDLMISSLLETRIGVDGTIKWATAMIKLSFR